MDSCSTRPRWSLRFSRLNSARRWRRCRSSSTVNERTLAGPTAAQNRVQNFGPRLATFFDFLLHDCSNIKQRNTMFSPPLTIARSNWSDSFHTTDRRDGVANVEGGPSPKKNNHRSVITSALRERFFSFDYLLQLLCLLVNEFVPTPRASFLFGTRSAKIAAPVLVGGRQRSSQRTHQQKMTETETFLVMRNGCWGFTTQNPNKQTAVQCV